MFVYFLVASIPLFAQKPNKIKNRNSNIFTNYSWDIGGGIGASNYLGDIGGYDGPQNDNSIKDLHFKSTSFSLNTFARVRFTKFYSLKLDATWARIKGADSLTQNWPERYARNLSFRTDIFEVSIQNFFFIPINDIGNNPGIVSLYPYVGGGVGVMYYNPQAYYNGKWHDLQPLNTEGKENQYFRFSPTIPLSFGMVFEWRKRYIRKYGKRTFNDKSYATNRLGIDFCYRVTFTDYLDDISTDYPDLEEMDETSRNLSSRSSEVINDPRSGNIPIENYTTKGSPRGDSSDNDHFLTITLTYSYNVNINNMSNSNREKYFQIKKK